MSVCLLKAISEPNFSVAYANMAKCMLNVSVFSIIRHMDDMVVTNVVYFYSR